MMRHLRAPSPALVISALALFVALAGTSYAALAIPHNSVGTAQLKNSAVTGAKIKNGAVTAAKVAAPEAYHEVGAAGQPRFQTGGAKKTLNVETTAGVLNQPFRPPALKSKGGGGAGTTTPLF